MSGTVVDPPRGDLERTAVRASGHWGRLIPEAVVLVVAFLLRTWVVVGDGGFRGNYFYDPGVYYGAADALTHGRMPYDDFVLVHPPMIALVTTPFAVLGRLTTDHTGFAAANLAYTALAAVNAVLVVRVARRFGVDARAALLGGLFYAVWLGAITAEFLTRLEPLGNFFVLVALLALCAARSSTTWRAPVGCGVLLACAVNVKLWFVVPAGIVLVWELVRDRAGRRAALIAAGVAAGCVVVDGPFLLHSGRRMFHALVTAQVGRPPNGVSVHLRLDKLSGVSQVFGGQFNDDSVLHQLGPQVLTVGFVALAVTACVVAARTSAGRLWVTMLAANLVVFLIVQVWFYTYCDFLAVPLSLVVAAAAGAGVGSGRARRLVGPAVSVAITAGSAALAVITLAGPGLGMVPPYPGAARLAAAVADRRCLVTDTPMNLVELNALDRSFEPGCRNVLDIVGFEMGGSDPADNRYDARNLARLGTDLCRYLTSGDAVLIDSARTWRLLPRACVERIKSGRVLVRAGGHTVYLVHRR